MKITFDALPKEAQENLREKAAMICKAVARVMRSADLTDAEASAAVQELLPWIEERHIEPMRDVGEIMMIYRSHSPAELDRVVLMLIEDATGRMTN